MTVNVMSRLEARSEGESPAMPSKCSLHYQLGARNSQAFGPPILPALHRTLPGAPPEPRRSTSDRRSEVQLMCNACVTGVQRVFNGCATELERKCNVASPEILPSNPLARSPIPACCHQPSREQSSHGYTLPTRSEPRGWRERANLVGIRRATSLLPSTRAPLPRTIQL
jgi:hypothetical protein